MNNGELKILTKIVVALTFIVMVGTNVLANALPINGKNTGEVSDSYGNLFAPAGLTFIIWGVIYVMLALFTLYQFGLFNKNDSPAIKQLLKSIAPYFIISSLVNTVWIFAWHYDYMGICLVLIATMLVLLIKINLLIDKETLSNKQKFFIRIPFAVYFGWVTVATIANATTLLVSLGWNGFGLSEVVWTVIILLVGAVIGFATITRRRNIPYGIVLLWAFGGILLKHVSEDGFAMAYLPVIITVVICLVLFVVAILFNLFRTKKQLA